MFAVVETGGKQYKVKEKDTIDVEKLEGDKGKKITFNKVLLVFDDKKAEIGTPYVKKARVEGEIVEQFKDKKIIVINFKNKVRWTGKKGHRQRLTRVKIKKITA
ncbi:50S ribosomal protein L21 [bacterium (Candidatus Torokbacteria) CG_4_10_14_0_2_um_filter_35_8]|nr:MAG: 50S ribosomal protein L21 [bacterium (Candidatus Torokbacteria) CG_4_10_14_0_2_um_filter_35_8]